MKRSVKFKKDYQMEYEGETVSFRADQIVELEEELALRLFQEGVVLPGIQFSEPKPMWD
jgi:hypothetical protein